MTVNVTRLVLYNHVQLLCKPIHSPKLYTFTLHSNGGLDGTIHTSGVTDVRDRLVDVLI